MRTTKYNLEHEDYYTPSGLGHTLVDSKAFKGDEPQDKIIKYTIAYPLRQ